MLNLRTPFTTYNFQYGWTGGVNRASLRNDTQRGVVYIFRQFKRDKFQCGWRVDTVGLSELLAHDLAVDGDAHPFVFIPNQAVAQVLYARKQPDFEYTNVSGSNTLVDAQWQLAGESAGVDILA
jgi:hypothetical protein